MSNPVTNGEAIALVAPMLGLTADTLRNFAIVGVTPSGCDCGADHPAFTVFSTLDTAMDVAGFLAAGIAEVAARVAQGELPS